MFIDSVDIHHYWPISWVCWWLFIWPLYRNQHLGMNWLILSRSLKSKSKLLDDKWWRYFLIFRQTLWLPILKQMFQTISAVFCGGFAPKKCCVEDWKDLPTCVPPCDLNRYCTWGWLWTITIETLGDFWASTCADSLEIPFLVLPKLPALSHDTIGTAAEVKTVSPLEFWSPTTAISSKAEPSWQPIDT